MSMDDEEGEEEEEEDKKHIGIGQSSSRDLLSPLDSMSPKDEMIHRRELDDQERLDLEEEARERELSGQGFSGAQTSGQTDAVQAGEYGSWSPFASLSFHHCVLWREWHFRTCERAKLLGGMGGLLLVPSGQSGRQSFVTIFTISSLCAVSRNVCV